MEKLLIFLAVFLLVIPLGTVATRVNDKVRLAVFAAMVASTAYMVLIHLVPMPDWRGTARGYALSATDILSSMLLLGMLIDRRCKVCFFPPGTWLYLVYFGLTILSVTSALHVHQWGFEIVKMFWMYIFFLAVYNYLIYTKRLWPLVYTICGVLLGMLVVALYQKYLGGRYQVPSTLSHQNSLSLYSSLYGALLLGILLNEKMNLYQMALVGSGVMAALLMVLFTFSRGGLFCFFVGVIVIVTASLILNGISGRQVAFSLVGIVGVMILVGIAAPRIIHRFQNAPEASKMTRINLAKAAVRIANDYPFGVGANNFSEYSGPFRKYAVEQHENLKIWEGTSPYGGIVETIYLLVAAECGWIALFALLCWFGYYYWISWRTLWSLRHLACCGAAIGILGGLTANYLQSSIEWVLKQYSNFYQLMLVFALAGAVWTFARNRNLARKSGRV